MLHASLASRLANQHLSLNETIRWVPEDHLRQRPEPATWSIYENIVHLTIYQPIFAARIDKILRHENVSFNPYRADDDPDFIAACHWRVDALLGKLKQDRQLIIRQLREIDPMALTRTGTHLRYGKLTIPEWTEFFLLHEAHHLFTIFKLAKT